MSEQEQHSSFIKTPQQLVTIVLLAFVVPIFGIVMLVQLVVNRPRVDPAAMKPEAVAERIQPVGKVEFGEPGAAAGGAARTGEELVKQVCAACHTTGAAGAPKIGDKAAWAPRIKAGLQKMTDGAVKGITVKGAMVMPPKGGAADASELEIARAIVYMVNQSGGAMKEPAEAAPAPEKKPAAKKK
jgi:cytochrome c5